MEPKTYVNCFVVIIAKTKFDLIDWLSGMKLRPDSLHIRAKFVNQGLCPAIDLFSNLALEVS